MGKDVPRENALAAYDVAKGRRLAQVGVAVLYLLVSAGIVFGFAALKPILIDEGVYRYLCEEEELKSGVTVCYGQEIRLNLMFTLAAVATNISALPIGAILDSQGPRFTSLVGCAILAVGSLLFAFGSDLPYDGYLPGYLFLAIGGPFVYIPVFHLSNTFPRHSGLILSIATGAFDCSSALFLIFRLIHNRLNGLLTVRTLFLCYVVVPAVIAVAQVFLMPSKSYKTMRELIQLADDMLVGGPYLHFNEADTQCGEQAGSYHDRVRRRQSMLSKIHSLLDGKDRGSDETMSHHSSDTDRSDPHDSPSLDSQRVTKSNKVDNTWGILHMLPMKEQIQSPMFYLMTIFTVIQMTRVNFFIATIRLQYEYLLGSDRQAATLNHVFDIILPAGGAVAAPPVGFFLDSAGMTTILSALTVSAAAVGILGIIPGSFVAGSAHIGLFVLFRPFFYTVISDYAAKVFGFQTFGKVYGLMIGLSGVGNLAQTPLDVIMFKVFNKNPIPLNVILLLVNFLTGAALVVYVWWRARHGSEIPHDAEENVDVGRSEEPGDDVDQQSGMETDGLLRSRSKHAYGATE